MKTTTLERCVDQLSDCLDDLVNAARRVIQADEALQAAAARKTAAISKVAVGAKLIGTGKIADRLGVTCAQVRRASKKAGIVARKGRGTRPRYLFSEDQVAAIEEALPVRRNHREAADTFGE